MNRSFSELPSSRNLDYQRKYLELIAESMWVLELCILMSELILDKIFIEILDKSFSH
jgi:hypothetical protein